VKKEYNASNAQDVAQSLQKDKLRRETEIDDLKKIIDTPHGRRTVWRILEHTGMYRTSFTGNSTTFFNEGQRNIGLWLVDEVLSADSNQYLAMIKENNKHGDQNA
jgi:hypothetical protein